MQLKARFDRPLARTHSASSRYLLLEITAPDRPRRQPRQPLNLAIVLDRSGSMAGEKLALARQAAAMLVRQLDDADRACVIAYDDEVSRVSPSRPATPAAKAELERLIRGIQSGGSTNLSGGWLEGCRDVANHQVEARRGIDRALLLTDGLANVGIVDQEELCTHAGELRARGISTSTFGIGADFNEDLLQAMADKGGGHYFYLRGPDDLAPSFRRELGELMEIVARDAVVEVRMAVAVELLNDQPVERLPDGVRVPLGDLCAREQIPLAFQVTTVPAATGSEVPIHALVMYREPHLGRGRELRFPDVALRHAADRQVDGQKRDFEVTKQVGLLYAARAKREAAALNREGRFDEARRLLERTAERIESYAGSDPELREAIRQLRELAPQAALPMAAPAVKEMTYAAYLTARNRSDY